MIGIQEPTKAVAPKTMVKIPKTLFSTLLFSAKRVKNLSLSQNYNNI